MGQDLSPGGQDLPPRVSGSIPVWVGIHPCGSGPVPKGSGSALRAQDPSLDRSADGCSSLRIPMLVATSRLGLAPGDRAGSRCAPCHPLSPSLSLQGPGPLREAAVPGALQAHGFPAVPTRRLRFPPRPAGYQHLRAAGWQAGALPDRTGAGTTRAGTGTTRWGRGGRLGTLRETGMERAQSVVCRMGRRR